jgi:hypothetical protein
MGNVGSENEAHLEVLVIFGSSPIALAATGDLDDI